MAHTKSAKKSIRTMERRRIANKASRSTLKTQLNKAEKLIVEKQPEPAAEAVKQAMNELDKAAQKGLIHLNNAARHKSRLMKRYNAAFQTKN